MSVSQISIYNMALMRIGQDIGVASPTENSKARRVCDTFWDACRQSALREFPWSFATGFSALAPSVGTAPMGYAYSYLRPSDMLRLYAVIDVNGLRTWVTALPALWCWPSWNSDPHPSMPRVPFRILGDAILTDQPEAYGVFVRDVTDTTKFDALFVDALAWRLASEIALPMVGPAQGAALAQKASQAYDNLRSQAQATSANEGQPDPPQDSPAIKARL